LVVRVLRVLKNRAAGSIAPTGSFADRRSVCVGADDFHRPGNAAIAGSFAEQSGHWIGKAGQPEVTAAGVNARPTVPRKWVPKNGRCREHSVPGFACRLPCIVGRAISPAGQHGGRRKAAAVGSFRGGRFRPPGSLAASRKLCGTMPSIVPYAGVLPAGSCCAGAELRLLHRRCAPGSLRNAACGRQ